MRSSTFFAPVLAVLILAAPAQAQDPAPDSPEAKAKAAELFKEANAHYRDEDPTKARELAEKALALSPKDVTIMGFLGTLHEIKTGDMEAAFKYYDQAIRGLVGVTSKPHLRFKADILSRKANLLYSEKDDVKGALELYGLSFETFQLSDTAFKSSNLLHRLWGEASDPQKKAELGKKALSLAEDAYKLLQGTGLQGDKAKFYAAKVRLQLAICLESLGEKEKAAKATEGLAQRDCDPETCGYNQAALSALRGRADDATEQLKAFLKTRPTPRARNRNRKVIRNDPDFKELVKRPDWKELVEDEDEKAAPPKKP